jgi:hypothetical protein
MKERVETKEWADCWVSMFRNGGLGRATSEFVSARLDSDGVQSGHKSLYWFGQE